MPVFAHKLRHTCATQLLNAGCPITSIQKLLGHKRLNTTLTYARAHDQTVAEDYFTAMARVEQRLDLVGENIAIPEPITPDERGQLLALVEQMSTTAASLELCFLVAAKMSRVLRRVGTDVLLSFREGITLPP